MRAEAPHHVVRRFRELLAAFGALLESGSTTLLSTSTKIQKTIYFEFCHLLPLARLWVAWLTKKTRKRVLIFERLSKVTIGWAAYDDAPLSHRRCDSPGAGDDGIPLPLPLLVIGAARWMHRFPTTTTPSPLTVRVAVFSMEQRQQQCRGAREGPGGGGGVGDGRRPGAARAGGCRHQALLRVRHPRVWGSLWMLRTEFAHEYE